MILQVKKRQQGEIADAAHKKNVTSGDNAEADSLDHMVQRPKRQSSSLLCCFGFIFNKIHRRLYYELQIK